MIRLVLALLVASITMMAAPVTINIYAALGPSPYPGDSPSYGTTYPEPGTYATTVQDALQAGGTDSGDINTDPTAFNKVTSVNAAELLYSSNLDPLWRGSLNPTGAFSNEVGTFLFFPFAITGGPMDMSKVHWSQTFSGGASGYDSSYNYTSTDVYSFEEMGFQSPSTYLIGGEAADTSVDSIYNTGGYFAFAFNMSGYAGTPDQQRTALLADLAALGNFTVSTCVSYDTQSPVCASVDVVAPTGVVPEPATYGLMGAGLLGLLALRRKRA